MTERPTAQELTEAIQEFLGSEILPTLSDHRLRFRMLVAMNALGIVYRELAALPANYDQGEAYGRYKQAREASVDLLIGLVPAINGLLTSDQKRKLPALVASHLDTRYLAGIRSGTAGNTGGGVFMPGMMMGGGGGGGGERIIIRGP